MSSSRRLGTVAALVAATLLAACSRAPSARDQRPGPEPLRNRGGTVAVDAAPAIDAPSACVAECVRSRQMQATAIDLIEQDCVRLCAMPAPPALP